MAILKLKVSDKILDRVLWLLGQFKSGELEVVETTNTVEEDKAYVKKELERLENGKAKTFSFEEVDCLLETTISNYEN